MPTFPNVPAAAGVPPLQRSTLNAIAPITALVADVVSILGDLAAPRWGIFKNGSEIVFADVVATVDYKQDWTIADYPMEDGAFQSYDKVQVPFEARVRFAAGGSQADRQALLASIMAIAGDTELYDVATPEIIYTNCNIQHYDYRRTATNGVGLMQVDVWLKQIRVSVTAQFSSTKQPAGEGPVSTGQVQGQEGGPAVAVSPEQPASGGLQVQ